MKPTIFIIIILLFILIVYYYRMLYIKTESFNIVKVKAHIIDYNDYDDIKQLLLKIDMSQLVSDTSILPTKSRDYKRCPIYIQNISLVPEIKNYLLIHPQTIPKIIHQIWIGPNKPPMKWIMSIIDFVQKNPEWSYKLWREKDIENIGIINNNEYNSTPEYAGKCDILRYELLFRFGGIYIDADSLWLGTKNFTDLLYAKSGFFAAYEKKGEDGIANGVIGSSINNPILYYIIRCLKGVDKLCDKVTACISTGPYLLDRCLLNMRDIITIYPYSYFYPTYWVNDDKTKTKDSIEVLKTKYKNSYLYQFGYSTNDYNDNDM